MGTRPLTPQQVDDTLFFGSSPRTAPSLTSDQVQEFFGGGGANIGVTNPWQAARNMFGATVPEQDLTSELRSQPNDPRQDFSEGRSDAPTRTDIFNLPNGEEIRMFTDAQGRTTRLERQPDGAWAGRSEDGSLVFPDGIPGVPTTPTFRPSVRNGVGATPVTEIQGPQINDIVPTGEWSEVRDGRGQLVGQTRLWSSADDRGQWREWSLPNGRTFLNRQYEQDGTNYNESWVQGNHSIHRLGGNLEAFRTEAEQAAPPVFLRTTGVNGQSLDIAIYGQPNSQELANLRYAIDQMPPEARRHAREIVLTSEIGSVGTYGGTMGPIGGIAGSADGLMVLARGNLLTPAGASFLVHHEAGHNLASASGNPELLETWRNLGPSISPYGNSSAHEDFAETHRWVMANWNSLANLGARELELVGNRVTPGPVGITVSPSSNRIMQILRLYGWRGPASGT